MTTLRISITEDDDVTHEQYFGENIKRAKKILSNKPLDDGQEGKVGIESLLKKAMHSPELLTKEERNKIINHKMTNEQVGEKIEEMALPSAVTGGVKEETIGFNMWMQSLHKSGYPKNENGTMMDIWQLYDYWNTTVDKKPYHVHARFNDEDKLV